MIMNLWRNDEEVKLKEQIGVIKVKAIKNYELVLWWLADKSYLSMNIVKIEIIFVIRSVLVPFCTYFLHFHHDSSFYPSTDTLYPSISQPNDYKMKKLSCASV